MHWARVGELCQGTETKEVMGASRSGDMQETIQDAVPEANMISGLLIHSIGMIYKALPMEKT